MHLISKLIGWVKGRPTNRQIEPIDTARLNYLDGFGSLNPDPGDNHELLLSKASRLVENYLQLYQVQVPPSHTTLEIARYLETLNRKTPAGPEADPALNLLLELHNPGSELSIEVTKLILSWIS